MTKTREKKVVISGVTRDQAEEAFATYAAADARTQQITAKMDVEITKIRERFQEELAKLQERKDESFDLLQTFATEQKDVLFGKKKSIEMVHGILGFRTGTHKLKLRKGFTWGAVTQLLREYLPSYIRSIEEPAKDKLLTDRDVPEVAELFPKVGILVDQDECFFVEPKKEELVNA